MARYWPIETENDLKNACLVGVFPSILKTCESGYDGKGQREVREPNSLESEWKTLGCKPCVLEEKVKLTSECSVIVARGRDGEIQLFGPFDNVHRNHILYQSTFPSALERTLVSEALQAAEKIASKLAYVGVLCVEFFVTGDGKLLANEMAPRPHNSGHLTIEAFGISQFEAQVRSVSQLP